MAVTLIVGPAAAAAAVVEARRDGRELRRFAPAGARWTAEELEPVAAATRVAAPAGTVILVEAVDRLGPGGADRLLKILEEPANGADFVLVADDADALGPTLAGRIDTVVAGAGDVAPVAAELAAAGADPAWAPQLAVWPDLVAGLAGDPVRARLVVTAFGGSVLDGAAAMAARAAAIEALAARGTAAARSRRAHQLAASVVEALREELRRRIPDAGAAELARVAAGAAALDRLAVHLRHHAHLATAFVAAAAEAEFHGPVGYGSRVG